MLYTNSDSYLAWDITTVSVVCVLFVQSIALVINLAVKQAVKYYEEKQLEIDWAGGRG